MRKLLDGLYAASGWLAGLSMIGVLLMVLLTIISRSFGFAAFIASWSACAASWLSSEAFSTTGTWSFTGARLRDRR